MLSHYYLVHLFKNTQFYYFSGNEHIHMEGGPNSWHLSSVQVHSSLSKSI